MKIKKDDQVLIISGKDRGRKGKVLKSLPKEGKIIVEKINIKRKHLRPKKQGEKGQVVEIPAPIDVSNVKIICPKCGKPARVGYKNISNFKSQTEQSEMKSEEKRDFSDHKNPKQKKLKVRICKKCGQEL
ncbi:MAG TPA: 50S ribosomal protein L24 [Candidatus Paceibacterota bacterium]|nr:50S ribosomal protein L24 [Candidatus Pacearchaeota archaeon]HQD89338.1 50S ribosomal protein L24 [Candidatus Pacearchaeota archaeon]HRR39561.1 50S ribosomal protein L24 [Candidatus Paceibacterota bacterium]